MVVEHKKPDLSYNSLARLAPEAQKNYRVLGCLVEYGALGVNVRPVTKITREGAHTAASAMNRSYTNWCNSSLFSSD